MKTVEEQGWRFPIPYSVPTTLLPDPASPAHFGIPQISQNVGNLLYIFCLLLQISLADTGWVCWTMCVHPTAHVFCPFWHFLLFLVALLFRWAECDIYSANVALRRRIVCQTSRLSYFFFFTKYCVIGWVGFFSVHTIKLDILHRYEQIGHPCAVAGATGNTVMQMSGSLPHSSSPLLTIISPRGQCDFLSFESSLSPLTFWLLLISSSYVRKGVRRRGGGGEYVSYVKHLRLWSHNSSEKCINKHSISHLASFVAPSIPPPATMLHCLCSQPCAGWFNRNCF